MPVEPGPWHFRQSIEYSQTANWAVLDFASRNSDHLLFNIWQMGTNAIERGNNDSWTTYPFEIDAAAERIRGFLKESLPGMEQAIDDMRADAAYRVRVAAELLRRAVSGAVAP